MDHLVGCKFCKVHKNGLEVPIESITLGVKIITYSVARIFLINGPIQTKIYILYLILGRLVGIMTWLGLALGLNVFPNWNSMDVKSLISKVII